MKRKWEDDSTHGENGLAGLWGSLTGESCAVEVTYTRLPRESKRHLDSLLRQWADWHAEHYPCGSSPPEVVSGFVALEPELQRLGKDTYAVIDDRPGPPAKSASSIVWFNIAYEKVGDVPLYDRGVDAPLRYTSPKKRRSTRWRLLPHELALLPLAGEDAMEAEVTAGGPAAGAGGNGSSGEAGRPAKRARGAQRCFNCGSYAHSMRDCWREFNKDLVEASKKEFADARDARGPGGRPTAKRYFLGGIDVTAGVVARGQAPEGQPSLAAEFDDVKPGQLTEGLRTALGLGLLDPPPWLGRMKAMGAPPGYRVRASRRKPAAAGAADPAPAAPPPLAGATQQQQQKQEKAAGGPPANCLQEVPAAAGAAVVMAGAAAAVAGSNGKLAGDGGPAVDLTREGSGSLESGELLEGDQGLGDYISVDGDPAKGPLAGAAAAGGEPSKELGGGEEEAAAAAVPVPFSEPPLGDFIPFELGEGEEEGEGAAEVAPGEPGWEECWVYAAQFPGVNAPIPEGADPAKWAAAEEGGAELPPGFGGGGRLLRPRSQPAQQHGTPHHQPPSRLGRLHGLHPPPRSDSAPVIGRHHHQPSPSPPLATGGSEPRYEYGTLTTLAQPLPPQQPPPQQQPPQHQQHPWGQQPSMQPAASGMVQAMQQQYSPQYSSQCSQQQPQQQQYSPLVQAQGQAMGMTQHHASWGQPQLAQPQQQFVASAADPGHLLALQPQPAFAAAGQPFPPPQQQQAAFAVAQAQQQAPLFAVPQAQQPQALAGGQQQQHVLQGMVPGGHVLEAYDPNNPAGPIAVFALQQQQQLQQPQQPPPPGLYAPQQQMW